jgi:hypothetical protein
MNQSKYLIPILLITLVLVVLTVTIYSTFQVGALKPTSTISSTSLQSSSPAKTPEGASQYPDQAHITDGILVFGIIVTLIILFDLAWGRRMSLRSLRKPPGR